MYISDKYKIIFIAIPKTGTRTIYNVLETHFQGYLYNDHELIIPWKYRRYKSFIIQRNPYDRACSMYWSLCKRIGDKYGYIEKLEENTFVNFLKLLRNKYYLTDNIRGSHCYPQSLFHTKNRIDNIISFENLENEFNQLDFVHERILLPQMNPTVIYNTQQNLEARPPSSELLNSESIQLINEIYKDDFDLLPYDKMTH